MSRNRALLLFIAAFALDAGINFAMESDAAIHRYGQFGVVLGAAAKALGHIIFPFLIVVVWIVVNLIRRRPLPQNFGRDALLTMAGLAVTLSLINVLQAR